MYLVFIHECSFANSYYFDNGVKFNMNTVFVGNKGIGIKC